MKDLFLNPLTWVNWFAPIVILATANILYRKTLEKTRAIFRYLHQKELTKIKNTRRNAYLIQWEISKTNSYFTLFLCSGILFYIALLTTTLLNLVKSGFFPMLITITPILFLEFLWLKQEVVTKKIIKSAQKIGKH